MKILTGRVICFDITVGKETVMLYKDQKFPTEYLVEANLITTPEKNLRSKIDSILRSLENLSAKRDRIDFEIKKQKRSLFQKRAELTRSNRTLKKKKISVSESQSESDLLLQKSLQEQGRLDSIQLQESDRVLNQG